MQACTTARYGCTLEMHEDHYPGLSGPGGLRGACGQHGGGFCGGLWGGAYSSADGRDFSNQDLYAYYSVPKQGGGYRGSGGGYDVRFNDRWDTFTPTAAKGGHLSHSRQWWLNASSPSSTESSARSAARRTWPTSPWIGPSIQINPNMPLTSSSFKGAPERQPITLEKLEHECSRLTNKPHPIKAMLAVISQGIAVRVARKQASSHRWGGRCWCASRVARRGSW
ncbi:hypothetical protein K438DRAFT_1763815 [Mycena galopus ATCC 62051]|nr:hypothetical protein K438DRAFT_1763815 [Mycena galopus ATCC 62051]